MTVQKSYCESAEPLVFTELANFNYNRLDNEACSLVRQRTDEIKNLICRSAQDIVDIGGKLIEVKEELGHGKFVMWLSAEFNWSESAARKFMQVHRRFKTVKFTDLNIATSALYLLASNSTSVAVRQEALERAMQGEIINYSKAKSIIAQHKEIGNRSLPTQITVDVAAQTVNEVSLTRSSIPSGNKSNGMDDQLSIQPPNSMPVDAINTCTKLISTIEDINSQLLELMEDEALKLLINKSKLLAETAKMLLTQGW